MTTPTTSWLTRTTSRVSRIFSEVAKALQARVRISLFTANERGPQMRTGDFRSYIQGLKLSEWSMISIMRIADTIMFHTWTTKDVDGNTIEDKSALVNRIFRRPNKQQTWVDFIEAIIWFWLPLGNCFIWKRPSLTPGVPAELHILWPDKVEIIPDETGRAIKEYKVTDNNVTRVYPADQVLQIRFGNPERRHWGLGRIEAAERVFDMDIAAADYAWRYFENDGTPGGALETDKRLHPDTIRDLKEQWTERHEGRNKAHKWSILQQGLKWNKMNASPQEAQFLETRKSMREAVLGLFGVPPEKAGILEHSNRSTAAFANRVWIRDTISPLLKRLNIFLSTITNEIQPGSTFEFEELVQEDSEEDVSIATGYFNLGAITPNEIRTLYAGLPKWEDNPAMDKTYLPVSVIPTGETPPPVAFSMDPSNGGANHAIDPEKVAGNGHRKQEEPDKKPPKGTPVQQRVLRSFRAQKAIQERKMRRKIASFFREQGERVISRLMTGKALGYIDTAKAYFGRERFLEARECVVKGVEDIFETAADERVWNVTVRGMFAESVEEEFAVTARLLGHDPTIPFNADNPTFKATVDRLAQHVTNVTETTRAALEQTVSDAVLRGDSPTELAGQIREQFTDFSRERSQLIARTESSRALDQANVNVYQQLGVKVVDVIGCEDSVIVPGQRWGCNSQGVPAGEASRIIFHPNHKGAIVPRVASARALAAMFDTHRKGVS